MVNKFIGRKYEVFCLFCQGQKGVDNVIRSKNGKTLRTAVVSCFYIVVSVRGHSNRFEVRVKVV